MSREMWFTGSARIEPDIFEEGPPALEAIAALVDGQIERDLQEIVGPRGGRYRQVGSVERVETTDEEGYRWIDYRVRARYVRPPRR